MKYGIAPNRLNMFSSGMWKTASFQSVCWGLIIFLIFAIAGCADENPDPIDLHDQNKVDAQMADFGSSNMSFAIDLLHETINQENESKNIIVSPLSVHIAMQMVLNGADGDTYDAIAKSLHSAEFGETSLNKSYQNLVNNLNNADDKTEIHFANSVFWDDLKINPYADFTNKMDTYFNAHLQGMDFQASESLTTINDWVDTNTNGKIDKILDYIQQDEVMFLINALYFMGSWKNPFPEEITHEWQFRLADGSSVLVPMMLQDSYLNFFIGPDLQAVDLIFGDSSFSMTCIRPVNENESIDAFIQNLDAERINLLWNRDLQQARLLLILPKFEIEYEINLNDELKALGMEIAFNRNEADLSRLGQSSSNLFINRVKHKTYLKIDEKGAEGAAVTGVGISQYSMPPTLFFDRSFVIILRDIKYNSILFAGKVENPIEE
jgi:serpin B